MALAALTLAGCAATAVPVAPAAHLTPAAAAVCHRLVARLPAVVGPGLDRRRVTPRSAGTAAWGQPPIVLRCGVPAPAVDPTAFVAVVDGVAWLSRNAPGGGYQVDSYRLPVVVSLRLPAAVSGADVLASISPVVSAVERTLTTRGAPAGGGVG